MQLRKCGQVANPYVSYMVITYNRRDDLSEAIECILGQDYLPIETVVVDNNSTDGTEKLFEERFNQPNIHYIKLAENLGVSGGRNAAVCKTQGDVIVTVDDDAVFADHDITRQIVNEFADDPSLGILAFKIVNYHTGELQKNAFPCRDKSVDPDREYETTWFIGAGHAIKREVYEKVGLYRDFRPWGSEELDFALRAIDAGYRIKYVPKIVIRHKISPAGRINNVTRFRALALKHRIKASALNLPWYSILSYSLIRSSRVLWRTHGNMPAILLAYYWLLRDLPYIRKNRSRIGRHAIRRLRALNGPLYF